MIMAKERADIVMYGVKMNTDGLSIGTGGNLSIFDPVSGYVAISPSGIEYHEISAEDIAVVTSEGKSVEGARKPSSELYLHTALYANRPEARAVVHTHSKFCTTFATLRKPILAVSYLIGYAGVDEVPCSEYATFGTEQLAENAIKALGDSKAVLLANHGLITYGASLKEAYNIALNIEYVAEIQWRAMSIGMPVVLNDEEMSRALKAFVGYGQIK